MLNAYRFEKQCTESKNKKKTKIKKISIIVNSSYNTSINGGYSVSNYIFFIFQLKSSNITCFVGCSFRSKIVLHVIYSSTTIFFCYETCRIFDLLFKNTCEWLLPTYSGHTVFLNSTIGKKNK